MRALRKKRNAEFPVFRPVDHIRSHFRPIRNDLRASARRIPENGDGFHYISTDYYETQVIRAGYAWKF